MASIVKATSMIRVLVVDDDLTVSSVLSRLIGAAGYDVRIAATGEEALRVARAFMPHVGLVDLRLPDISGIELIRTLTTLDASIRAAILTGFASLSSVVEAMRAGAVDYVEKPLEGRQVVTLIERLASPGDGVGRGVMDTPEAHALSRWADCVVRGLEAAADPRTLFEWGRAVGASVGAIRNWCRTARISSRRSLLFTRVLRAVVRHQVNGAAAEDLLNFADRRTLARLLTKAGGTEGQLPPTVGVFLAGQQLIEHPGVSEAITRRISKCPDGVSTEGAADCIPTA